MKSCYHPKLEKILIQRKIMSRKNRKFYDNQNVLAQENFAARGEHCNSIVLNQLTEIISSNNKNILNHQTRAMLSNHHQIESSSSLSLKKLFIKRAKIHPLNRCLNMKQATPSLANKNLLRPTLVSVTIATLALVFCLIIHTNADANVSPAIDKNILPSASQDIKQNSNERSDEPLVSKSESAASSSSSSPSSASASSSSQNSIVASLSSAVASAAAAAAVAAAQNSLSGTDARSLLSNGATPKGQHHAQRSSSGLHLAIKLADAIPEVPYNILHNMKKLDHAAPFYNVPNKLASSTAKESGQNFFSSALIASGGLGGAAEQFGALFRSPLWKRLADGYGDFASEFRSLFRGSNRVTPMKGTTSSSSTAKLIRDISVPALLMLLASTGIQGSDWRPGRTRRKSFTPVEAPQNLGGPRNGLHISTDLQSLSSLAPPSLGPLLGDNKQSSGLSSYSTFGSFDGSLQNAASFPFSHSNNQQPQFESNNIINGLGGDLNLPQSESQSRPSWMSAMSRQQQNYPAPNDQQQLHHQQLQQQQQQQQLQQQPQYQATQALRRSGEYSNPTIVNSYSPSQQQQQQHQVLKPMARNDGDNERFGQSSSNFAARDGSHSSSSSLLGSLTSGLSPNKLMNKMFDAKNLNSNLNSMKSTTDEQLMGGMLLPIKRDQLSDKQRYTLIGPDDNNLAHFGNLNEPIRLSPQPSKPFLLSAMTHAIASVLNPQQQESGSAASRDENRSAIGNNLINQARDSFARKQPQVSSSSSSFVQEGNKVEQRDLSQFLPPTWREVVKRTVNNVQQQATSQWKSIEGQLANWVQDKIKSLPVGASSSSPAASSSSSSSALGSGSSSSSSILSATSGNGAASSPQVANILASVGSTAMNMLGLGNKSTSSRNSSIAIPMQAASINSAEQSSYEASGNPAATVNSNASSQRGKPIGQQLQQVAKGTLAGVADIIVNSLSGRTSAAQNLSVPPSFSSSSSTITTTANANNHAASAASANSPNNLAAATTDNKKASIGAELIQAMTSVASQYPTLTGAPMATDSSKTTIAVPPAPSS